MMHCVVFGIFKEFGDTFGEHCDAVFHCCERDGEIRCSSRSLDTEERAGQ